MKLRLKATRKTSMVSFVAHVSSGTFYWAKVGDVLEVEDDVAHELLSQNSDMLEKIEVKRRAAKKEQEEIKEGE